MYASSWMLLRPFAAMKGCRGGSGAEIGLGWAGAPMNAGGGFACGLSGIGSGATAAVAPDGPARATSAKAKIVRRSLKTTLPRPGDRLTAVQITNLPRQRRAQTRLAPCRHAETGAALRGRG